MHEHTNTPMEKTALLRAFLHTSSAQQAARNKQRATSANAHACAGVAVTASMEITIAVCGSRYIQPGSRFSIWLLRHHGRCYVGRCRRGGRN